MDAVVMDAQTDLTAAHDARQPRALTLERTAGMLVEPRDPEMVRRATEALQEHEKRQAQERAAEAERNETRPAPSRPLEAAAVYDADLPSVKGGYADNYPTYRAVEQGIRNAVRREKAARNDQVEAIVSALCKQLRNIFDALATAREKTTWRFEEAERRIADLEERLAKLEGQGNG